MSRFYVLGIEATEATVEATEATVSRFYVLGIEATEATVEATEATVSRCLRCS